MHNVAKENRRDLRAMAHATCVAAAALLLGGCTYLIYFPLLLFAPLMPLIQLAIRLAARYGPLLLMLAEADPSVAPGAPMMIAAEPTNALQQVVLDDLETRLNRELDANGNLRAVSILEVTQLTPEFLEEQCRLAQQKGYRLRMVFVDSWRFADGAALKAETIKRCATSAVRLQASEGLAAQAAGGGAEVLAIGTAPMSGAIEPGISCLLAAQAGGNSIR